MKLKDEIKEGNYDKISYEDRKKVLDQIMKRKRLDYKLKDIIQYMFHCLCFRRLKYYNND